MDPSENKTDRILKDLPETHLFTSSDDYKHTNGTGVGRGVHYSYTGTTLPPLYPKPDT